MSTCWTPSGPSRRCRAAPVSSTRQPIRSSSCRSRATPQASSSSAGASIEPESGQLVHDFSDSTRSTRFLGDLYQDLSEAAKKQYALLQTPVFVEEFILDRTLEPAIDEFGLAEVRLIDPACGSGHFLLGAFARLLAHWREREPGTDVRTLVERSLDAVCGVDLNPFAAEIARFRLLVAAVHACGVIRLRDAPDFVRRSLSATRSCTALVRAGCSPTQRLASAATRHLYATEDGSHDRPCPRPSLPRGRRQPAVHHAKGSSTRTTPIAVASVPAPGSTRFSVPFMQLSVRPRLSASDNGARRRLRRSNHLELVHEARVRREI